MSFIEVAHELGQEHALKGFKRETGGKFRIPMTKNWVLRSIGTVLIPSWVIGRGPRGVGLLSLVYPSRIDLDQKYLSVCNTALQLKELNMGSSLP